MSSLFFLTSSLNSTDVSAHTSSFDTDGEVEVSFPEPLIPRRVANVIDI